MSLSNINHVPFPSDCTSDFHSRFLTHAPLVLFPLLMLHLSHFSRSPFRLGRRSLAFGVTTAPHRCSWVLFICLLSCAGAFFPFLPTSPFNSEPEPKLPPPARIQSCLSAEGRRTKNPRWLPSPGMKLPVNAEAHPADAGRDQRPQQGRVSGRI